MVQEGVSPTASLDPVVLSQSNVEGNQLKHIPDLPKDAPTEDSVLSGQTLENVQSLRFHLTMQGYG